MEYRGRGGGKWRPCDFRNPSSTQFLKTELAGRLGIAVWTSAIRELETTDIAYIQHLKKGKIFIL